MVGVFCYIDQMRENPNFFVGILKNNYQYIKKQLHVSDPYIRFFFQSISADHRKKTW